VPSYLVELYLPRSRADEAPAIVSRARAAAAELTAEGMAVRYVRTTYVPDDETCFHLFEADSASPVEEVCTRAALGRIRIVAAVDEPAETQSQA
jgi:hypothetical protein